LIPESRLTQASERGNDPRFAAALKTLQDSTDEILESPIEPPDRPAGFYHNYFCPSHGTQLRFDPAEPHQHRCTVDGQVFEGNPYDAAWRWFVNSRLSKAVFHLGLRFRIEEDTPSLERAREILIGYASRYGGHPVGNDAGYGQGRATFQSLDEAVWLIPLVRGYDLIRESLGEGDQKQIETGLLIPAAEHILTQKYDRIHNIECWHNAALAAVGYCLDDDALVDRAVGSAFGFHHQLADGVRDDGLWWEGSSSYHFYALAALMTLAQLSEGEELRTSDRLRTMFDAPIRLAGPDNVLPAFNDCWYFSSLDADVCHGVPPAYAFYEVAFGWYGAPGLAAVAARSAGGAARGSLEALIYGADDLPPASPAPRSSVLFQESGIACARTVDVSGRPLELSLKFGPHGGTHGHPDKLSLTLWAADEAVSPDLGTPGYGIDLHESWYRHTLSHNTFLIDKAPQSEAEGELFEWETSGQTGRAAASVSFSGSDYDGVVARRVLMWDEGAVVDVLDVRCSRSRLIDWVFRVRGVNPKLSGLAPDDHQELSGDAGYRHIVRPLWWKRGSGEARIDWTLLEGAMAVAMPGETGSVLVGAVPFSPASKESDILIRRRRAESARFITAFVPFETPETRITVETEDNNVLIDVGDKHLHFTIDPSL